MGKNPTADLTEGSTGSPEEGVHVLKMGLEAIVRRRKLTDDLIRFYEEKFKSKEK